MSALIVMAVGTRRGKAEAWLKDLPDRFPSLDPLLVSKEELPDLPNAIDHPDLISVLVVDEPYVDVDSFRNDVETAMRKGWEVAFEYFPGEPLILLIQADQKSGAILGAEILRKELQKLQELEKYESVLLDASEKCLSCEAVA